MIEGLFPGLSALQNIHPMLVHFPIAFFVGALAMEAMAVFRDEKFHLVATWMLYLGTLSAIITLFSGFIAAGSVASTNPRGHQAPGHEFIHIHRNFMAATTLWAILLSGFLYWINKRGKWKSQRWILLIGLIVLGAMVSLGADRGGQLVFEFGVGVNPGVIKEIP
ncbi:MAG TPA: DUF2231 domain-containing protein [Nitrospiria bacterium]|nr:DUF2231 domain-containing protein [Nitrospiria bacterium]